MGKHIALDLDPKLVEQIDKLAHKDERSRASMIRQLIKRVIEESAVDMPTT